MKPSAQTFDEERRRMFYAKTDLPLPDAELQALRQKSDAELGLTRERLLDLVETHGGPVLDLGPLAQQGTFHRLFRLRFALNPQEVHVLRVPVLGQAHGLAIDAWAHQEAWFEDAGGLQGVETIGEYGAQLAGELLPLAPGTCLATHDADDAFMDKALQSVGKKLAILHALPGQKYGPLAVNSLETQETHGLHDHWRDYLALNLDAHVQTCLHAGVLQADEAHKVTQLLGLLQKLPNPEPRFLHCDLGSHNVFVDEDAEVTAFLDWEDVAFGDPLFDLAMTATFQPARRHAALFQGYFGGPLPAKQSVVFSLYFLRIELAKIVHRLRFGYADKPGRPGNRQRILAALERLQPTSTPTPARQT